MAITLNGGAQTIFVVNYDGQYGNKYEFRAQAREQDVSTSGNVGLVVVDVLMRRPDGSSDGAWNQNGTYWSITIDEETFSGTAKWDTRGTSDWQYLGFAEKWITHNPDGNKIITISAYHTGNSASGSSKMGNAGGSATVNLQTIPRYTTVYNSLRSKTSTSISINWSTTDARDWTQYSINGGSWQDAHDTVASDNKSGYYTISGLSPNTTYTIKTRCRRMDSGLWSEARSISATTYKTTTPTISLSSKTSTSITVNSGCNVNVLTTYYRIRTSGGSYGSYQSSSTFTGLSPNTSYVIEVYKVASDSGEAGTATLSATTYKSTVPTISLSSKTINSITVTSGCNVTVSTTYYRIKTSSGSYGSYQTSATFTGLSPNTSYVVEVYKVGTESGEAGTATLSVATYNIAKITSASSFNLGDNETITYTNPSGSSILTAIYTTGGESLVSYRSCSGSSYTYPFTDSELDILYKRFGSSNSITVRIWLRTDCNGVNYYDSKDITITLTGNQKTIRTNVNASWKRGKVWININGSWKRAVIWTNVNGTWKRSI